jgi:hypothetical protein
VTTTSTTQAAIVGGNEVIASAVCPAGKRVIAGGVSIPSGSWARLLTLFSSYPVSGGATESWVVELRNNVSTNLGLVTLTVYATCVSQ